MENYFIWLITIVVILIIFIPYYRNFRRNLNKDRERRDEAVRLGADRPIAQFPQIDKFACIGCGACVAACPEGDVLGIVAGKATVINGLKCVGHGRCAEACPVEGITVGLGDISKRDDIPFMTEHQETNISGVFIAGELGGLALIRNAIEQGRRVVDYITAQKIKSSENGIPDILIIGAGPAGLSAALQAKSKGLYFKIIDQEDAGGTILQYPRKKLVMTKPVEIPLYGALTKPEYTKEELLEIWQDAIRKFELKLEKNEKVLDIKREDNRITVITSKNRHQGQSVVLALGRRGSPRKLNIPGEHLPKVMYKLMDAESYQDDKILVVGGGDSAIEAAMGLARQKLNEVTLSYRKDSFFRIKKRNEERINKMIADKKINVIFNSNILEIKENSVRLSIEDHTEEIENGFVFIFAGGEPPFGLLKKIGIQFGLPEKANVA
jgi:thioredoxin reductase (NADPH)